MSASTCSLSEVALQSAFASILPTIERYARVYFRHLPCHDTRADRVAEVAGLAWAWFRKLIARGKNPTRYPAVLASFACRAVKCGRRVCGMAKAKDVMNPHTQQRAGFVVQKLPDRSSLDGHIWDEALHDNTASDVPSQAAFRVDFPRWRTTRTERDRRIMDDLMLGERTKDVAKKYGVSPACISVLRRKYHEDWSAFCGDDPVNGEQPVPATVSPGSNP